MLFVQWNWRVRETRCLEMRYPIQREDETRTKQIFFHSKPTWISEYTWRNQIRWCTPPAPRTHKARYRGWIIYCCESLIRWLNSQLGLHITVLNRIASTCLRNGAPFSWPLSSRNWIELNCILMRKRNRHDCDLYYMTDTRCCRGSCHCCWRLQQKVCSNFMK